MDHGQVLPLFPLGIVVFPDQALPLHIFENRYKEMIADCCAEGEGEYEPFGLSFEHEGNAAPVGCAVQVMKVTREYSNGTFDIVCRAVWRYRTLEVREHERSYLMAHVERLDDEEVGPVDPSIRLLVRERLGQLTDLAAQDMGSLGYGSHDDDPEQSLDALDVGDAFVIAQRIGLEPSRRQALLELLSENARLQYLADLLDDLLPTMQKRQDRQRRVKTNGYTTGD
ncbi:MAG: LON peptidase substrate-binding domain-containing protein [Candidatus Latescibacteria bacterium]|jgi:ATP-dependent Lon protease|nr:LON peptidase substrate-binding domain-containing protein [Candidatus Latescibacterota bacterium]